MAGGTALRSLVAALGQNVVLAPGFSLGMLLGAVIGGTAGSYLGGRFLLTFADTATERRSVLREVVHNTVTALLTCSSILAVTLMHVQVWLLLAVVALGLGAVSWQCLGRLRRTMPPLVARDNACHGRRFHWRYETSYGWTGVMLMNLIVVAAIVVALLR
ncbi:MAG: hypothetical protein GAK43_00229 [Stenotrophomonas maltophilia]|nr:MAG: hypothetical protein GAK43_00229 [Stenotrophomonas maltophilia]